MNTNVHDDSSDPVQRNRTESVSDTSQYVTDESVVPDFFSDSSANTSISDLSGPSLEHQSRDRSFSAPLHPNPSSNFESINESMSRQLTSSIPINQTFDAPPAPSPPPLPLSTGSISLPNSHFSCPRYPRTFPDARKADKHVKRYRHTYACPNQGCRWSFHLPKDLKRHVDTHKINPTRLRCPVLGCSTGRGDGAFSRPDLLKRHVENFH